MADKEPVIADQILQQSTAESADASAETAHDALVATVSAPDKSKATQNGMFWLQRVFVLVAIGIFSFSVYDTYSKQREPLPPRVQQPFDSLPSTPEIEVFRISDAVEQFAARRIFGPAPRLEDAPTQTTTQIRGWRAEVRENWSLKGSSAIPDSADDPILEAIVFDGRSQRLQFLRVGAIIQIFDQDVEVTRVEPDRVELRREDEIFVLD